MNIEDIIKKYNYNDEISNFLRNVYPILVEYFSDERIVYEALLSTPIKLTDNVYNCLIENGFLKDREDNEIVSLETLKFSAGAYHCEPVIKYEKNIDKYTLEGTNRIIAINASSLESNTTKATLIHEISHLIKSYYKEHTIKEDTLVEKSGLINKVYQLSQIDGKVQRKTCFENGVGLEEAFNTIVEEEITSKLIGEKFNTKGYQLMKSLANDILSYNIPNFKEQLLETEVYHDTTRIVSTLGETYYKLIDFGDKIYPMLLQILNPSITMHTRVGISEEIDKLISEEYIPVIRTELERKNKNVR